MIIAVIIAFTLAIFCYYLLTLVEGLNEKCRVLEDSKNSEVKEARADAIKRSKSVTSGKVLEVVAPYLPGFPTDCDDLSFLGNPIDFVGFSNTDDPEKCSIEIIEAKTGNSRLTKKQKIIKEAVKNGRVNWHEFKIEK